MRSKCFWKRTHEAESSLWVFFLYAGCVRFFVGQVQLKFGEGVKKSLRLLSEVVPLER